MEFENNFRAKSQLRTLDNGCSRIWQNTSSELDLVSDGMCLGLHLV